MNERDLELSLAIDALTELLEFMRMSGLASTSRMIRLTQEALKHCEAATTMQKGDDDER